MIRKGDYFERSNIYLDVQLYIFVLENFVCFIILYLFFEYLEVIDF